MTIKYEITTAEIQQAIREYLMNKNIEGVKDTTKVFLEYQESNEDVITDIFRATVQVPECDQ